MTPEMTEINTDINATPTVNAAVEAAPVTAVENEIPPQDKTRKKHIPLSHRISAKFVAFVIAVITMLLTVVSILLAIFIAEEELYFKPVETFREELFDNVTYSDSYVLASYILNSNTEDALTFCKHKNYSSCSITDNETGASLFWMNDSSNTSQQEAATYSYTFITDNGAFYPHYYEVSPSATEITVKLTLSESFNIIDELYFIDHLTTIIYALRYYIYLIMLALLIILCASCVFLMYSSGRRSGLPTAQPGWGTKVPFDLLTGAAIFVGCCFIAILNELSYHYSYFSPIILTGLFLAIASAVIIVGWLMSLALRIKLGKWWKNTIVYYVLNIVWRMIVWTAKKCIHALATLIQAIPLAWKSFLAFTIVISIEVFIVVLTAYDDDYMILFLLFNILLVAAFFYTVWMLLKLQLAARSLASGDLNHKVDTSKMILDFKEHGQNLNSISQGMTKAVEERVKSERMKTELITNVSHDIKTPLTSIINYADLISKESCDNAAINEYSKVLLRQSERLKRLIEDLVEVSKANTGNLEVILTPCETNVFLTQIAGEYEQKFADCNLELIISQPENGIQILADGRRLWRVFDNLMNNICKYAQSGTRVYITLEQHNLEAVITFRNTSRDALNMPAEELMERFTRGDSSRNTEGNGLGLSIAQSLTELQNGKMELVIDGDLFKVILHFPVIS